MSEHPSAACVVIPVYNHAGTVAEVVRGAFEHVETVLVWDDGSTDGSGDRAREAGAVVLGGGVNQGKGTALRGLLAEAHRRGFRWAVAVDSDGQHQPSEIPLLLNAAAQHPGALIIGTRDLIAAGAPPINDFGRRSSNYWIWLETGNRVEDSQSGFRAYPLPEILELGCRKRRYDFEVEVLLRASWAGLPIRSVPIQVIYPKNRITHFKPWLENTRIVWMNALACLSMPLPIPIGGKRFALPQRRPGWSLYQIRRWFWFGGEGALWRLAAAGLGLLALSTFAPRLLLGLGAVAAAAAGIGGIPVLASGWAVQHLTDRGLTPATAAAAVLSTAAVWGGIEQWRNRGVRKPRRWTGRSRGGVFGHWFFFTVTRHLGVAPAYGVLYPIAFYFLLAAGFARRASMSFLDHAVGKRTGLGRWLRSYRHLLAFARTMVDRALMSTRGPESISCERVGLEHIREAAAAGRGAILLTAHIGNWEVAANMLDVGGLPKVAVVAFRGEEERLARYLEKAHARSPRIIKAGEGFLSSLELVRELRSGALLAMQGDRPLDHHWVKVPFLGREAPFPVGPFMLAAVSGAPLISTFSVQTGRARYQFCADPPRALSFARGRDRDTQLREWAAQYVARLEEVARAHPFQWFNFYDFWDAPPPQAPGEGAQDSRSAAA